MNASRNSNILRPRLTAIKGAAAPTLLLWSLLIAVTAAFVAQASESPVIIDHQIISKYLRQRYADSDPAHHEIIESAMRSYSQYMPAAPPVVPAAATAAILDPESRYAFSADQPTRLIVARVRYDAASMVLLAIFIEKAGLPDPQAIEVMQGYIRGPLRQALQSATHAIIRDSLRQASVETLIANAADSLPMMNASLARTSLREVPDPDVLQHITRQVLARIATVQREVDQGLLNPDDIDRHIRLLFGLNDIVRKATRMKNYDVFRPHKLYPEYVESHAKLMAAHAELSKIAFGSPEITIDYHSSSTPAQPVDLSAINFHQGSDGTASDVAGTRDQQRIMPDDQRHARVAKNDDGYNSRSTDVSPSAFWIVCSALATVIVTVSVLALCRRSR